MSEPLTTEQASALVGDDIAYHLHNPFMTPELIEQKVCWWITRALDTTPTTPGQSLRDVAREHGINPVGTDLDIETGKRPTSPGQEGTS